MKFLGKYWIILLLCVVVIGMATIKAKYGYNGTSVEIEPTPIVTAPPQKPTLIPGFELLNSLPYSGIGFVVEKYSNPNELTVKVKGIDQNLAKKMVMEWIAENKVATSSYKLKFE